MNYIVYSSETVEGHYLSPVVREKDVYYIKIYQVNHFNCDMSHCCF